MEPATVRNATAMVIIAVAFMVLLYLLAEADRRRAQLALCRDTHTQGARDMVCSGEFSVTLLAVDSLPSHRRLRALRSLRSLAAQTWSVAREVATKVLAAFLERIVLGTG